MPSGNEQIREKATIELAKPEDARAIIEITKRGWLRTFVHDDGTYQITPEDIDDHFADRLSDEGIKKFGIEFTDPIKSITYVARVGRKIVGYAAIHKFKDERHNNPISIFVDEEYEGTGTYLMRTIRTAFKETFPGEDCGSVIVTYNEHAWKIFKALGFEKIGEPFERFLNTRRGLVPQPMIRIVCKAENI